VQSIVATEIGYEEKAMEYFLEAVAVDLGDIGGNVIDRRAHRIGWWGLDGPGVWLLRHAGLRG
jgi:hypothetical protein